MPTAVPFGRGVLQFDFSAASLITSIMRLASKPSPPRSGAGYFWLASISRRNCTGSFPAASASSSMNDWNTNAVGVAARSAQRAGGHAERDLRIAEVEVLDEQRRELAARDVRGGGVPGRRRPRRVGVGGYAEGHEVVLPRRDLAARVHRALQVVVARRAGTCRGACRLRASTTASPARSPAWRYTRFQPRSRWSAGGRTRRPTS